MDDCILLEAFPKADALYGSSLLIAIDLNQLLWLT